MNDTLPISQARSELPALVEKVSGLSHTVYITVKGKIKAALISAKELELLNETLEVLSDPDAVKAIEAGLKDIKQGKTVPWEKVKQEMIR